ncbi:glycosyltransferase 87 family protein [uncultured Frigoribacterium sp.]|uniref:glycosyltransferase 87 family protein n=1 Tax=uncultured Frigoribacterium sp. TaxID=335377 RepID=UPI0028D6D987|nr:glycosyltransferase 87 family protein [uncultured Frigoribacterium sp.]
MTVAAPPRAPGADGASRRLPARVAAHPAVLWSAFVIVHLVVGHAALTGPNQPMGDVWSVYRTWMQQGVGGGDWVGVDRPWVYPLLAAVPMLLARVGGDAHYGQAWLTIVLLLDAGAFAVLTGGLRGRRHVAPAWWWLLFLLALGPIAVGRIDAVTVPFAIVGLLLLSSRPTAASVLLTVAAWIKVWPAALVVAAVVALRGRARRDVVVGAVATTVTVVAISLVLGSGATVLGFVGEQAGRGLQVESPTATAWLWRAAAGMPGAFVYYDHQILTYQVEGDGVGTAARLTTVLMGLVVLLVLLLGLRAVRRGASAVNLLAPLSLAFVTALIVTNKVGSPQFVSWLAPPVVIGLVLARRGGAAAAGGSAAAGPARAVPAAAVPAVLAVGIAALTQVIYPWEYQALLGVEPWMLVLITVRNLGEVALLVVALVQLWRVGLSARAGSSGRAGDPAEAARTLQNPTDQAGRATPHPDIHV